MITTSCLIQLFSNMIMMKMTTLHEYLWTKSFCQNIASLYSTARRCVMPTLAICVHRVCRVRDDQFNWLQVVLYCKWWMLIFDTMCTLYNYNMGGISVSIAANTDRYSTLYIYNVCVWRWHVNGDSPRNANMANSEVPIVSELWVDWFLIWITFRGTPTEFGFHSDQRWRLQDRSPGVVLKNTFFLIGIASLRNRGLILAHSGL